MRAHHVGHQCRWRGQVSSHHPLSSYHGAPAATTKYPNFMSTALSSPSAENPYCALWNLTPISSKSPLFSAISPIFPELLAFTEIVIPWWHCFLVWWLFCFFFLPFFHDPSTTGSGVWCYLCCSLLHSEVNVIRLYLPLAFFSPATSDPWAMLPYFFQIFATKLISLIPLPF